MNKRFTDRIEKLQEADKTEINKVKQIEDEREKIMEAFEEELKNLELKYDKILAGVTDKKKEAMNGKELFADYWLRVFSNHKIVKEFVAAEDKDLLKHLKNLKSEKLEDGNSFKLIFEFEANDFFTNASLEKTYYVSKDLLIEKIDSTVINWKEGKNLCMKKTTKTLKNKSKAII